MRFLKIAGLILLAILGMASCTPTDNPLAPVNLPLVEDSPTLLFFYTDG